MHFVDRRHAGRQSADLLARMRGVCPTVGAVGRRAVLAEHVAETEFDETAEGRLARVPSGRSEHLTGVLAVPRNPAGAVVFAYGSGTGTAGARNQYLAQHLYQQGMATLLLDLLTEPSAIDRHAVFDIGLLGRRLLDATEWLRRQPGLGRLPLGYFGAGTGAAAAVWAAAEPGCQAAALVLLSGRPDLAGTRRLASVAAPTLLIVGAHDAAVLDLNQRARLRLRCVSRLVVVPTADHRFDDARSLAVAVRLSEDWFTSRLTTARIVRPEAGQLILLRHAQSEFNAANRFTGWVDPPLTSLGEREAVRAGLAIAAAGYRPDVAFTSVLQRAVTTTRLVLDAADCALVPVHRTWRLNGRHYGALQGKDKTLIQREYGAAQVQRWRRSYDGRPPALLDDPNLCDPRYTALPVRVLPHAESLRDVTARLLPYWRDAILPELAAGRRVLVVSHGNTLRALIKELDGVCDDEIAALEVPTARPLLYRLDAAGRPLVAGGLFLDGDTRTENEDADARGNSSGN